ncbi:MAG: hypothetical protein AAFU85_07905 [Planctomycetota bacterium]
MRLTLRTLLAYLDNTVDPADAEALRQKLQQSGFATQLVAAIRASIHAKSVSAPAPDSVHPIEEPNMMSEYLDSTLSPEQIAEVERSCLESEVNLAEAASCHQILTMILGKPANPSEAIKGRIYDMVDSSGNVIADLGAGGSSPIAGEIGPRVGFGMAATQVGLKSDNAKEGFAQSDESEVDREAETAEANRGSSFNGLSIDAPTPVPPVGVDDSGVFDAPTKLRQQTFATPDAGATLGETETLAGDRPLSALEKSDFYEGDVRPSRITPWIVSLALAGVLLFAIGKIFQPLLRTRVAANQDQEQVSDEFPDLPSGSSALLEEASPESVSPSDSTSSIGEWSDDGPPPIPETIPMGEASEESEVETTNAPPSEVNSSGEPVMAMETLPAPSPDGDPAVPPSDPSAEGNVVSALPESGGMKELIDAAIAANVPVEPNSVEPKPAAPTDADVATKNIEPATDSQPMESVDTSAVPDEVAATVLARFESKDALVGKAMDDNSWRLMAPDSDISSGTSIVCAPEYRASFRLAGDGEADERSLASIVGPSKIEWMSVAETPGIRLAWGRGMITNVSLDNEVALLAEGIVIKIQSRSIGGVLAFELTHKREIGDNPLIAQSHSSNLTLLAAKEDHVLTIDGNTLNLDAGERVTWAIGSEKISDPEMDAPESLPAWLDPDIDTGSLEAEAASTLLELVRGETSESLALSLRVALDFRRNEVAALAGKSMLALGDASAYFGIDGLLGMGNQRLYWSSHLDSLREMVDRSQNDATLVRKAIAGNEAMDDADGDILFRLLVGFSQDQLIAGEDASLVKALESGSMPVRVLASENLRDITGKTLYFKPEETVASRRSEVIKKWNVNLIRKQIRWPEKVETPVDGVDATKEAAAEIGENE